MHKSGCHNHKNSKIGNHNYIPVGIKEHVVVATISFEF